MERPSLSVLASLVLHAGLAALAWWYWPREAPRAMDLPSAVPVSIVSDVPVAAAPADNPAPVPVAEPAPTAPPPAPTPASVPPTKPTPPEPLKPAAKKTPTPPKPAPPRPAPPRPQPPALPRDTATLDLDALAGPPRPRPGQGLRPATGQQGAGAAAQAAGRVNAAIIAGVNRNWNLTFCSLPGGDELAIRVEVRIDASGRISDGPTLLNPSSDPSYRAAADSALRALRVSAPFDVPDGFTGAVFRPTFNTERACRR